MTYVVLPSRNLVHVSSREWLVRQCRQVYCKFNSIKPSVTYADMYHCALTLNNCAFYIHIVFVFRITLTKGKR